MFTGLVEEIGLVAAAEQTRDGYALTIQGKIVLDNVKLGDSIAVNGVCLTVTAFDDQYFTVGLAPETLSRTNLGDAKPGDAVHLERALLPSTRLGGHFVQGHIDSTGTIQSLQPDKDSLWVRVETSPALMRYIVVKGYIAVDGVSLTVVDTGDNWFSVMLVDYTQRHVTLPRKRPGDSVNLEVDILAKYAERLLSAPQPAATRPAALRRAAPTEEGIR